MKFNTVNPHALAGLAIATVLGSVVAPAEAATIRFDTDPFDGSTALETPGRQIIGDELFLDAFSVDEDVFSFDPDVFGVETLSFFNGFGADLTGNPNAIVLQDSDPDADPSTPFLAGTAANLIAEQLDTDGAGFFVYFNTNLQLNRLVYSTNLNDNTADLKILARVLTPLGDGAIAALPTFTADNFVLEDDAVAQSVPEPTTSVAFLGLGAIAACGHRLRRRGNRAA